MDLYTKEVARTSVAELSHVYTYTRNYLFSVLVSERAIMSSIKLLFSTGDERVDKIVSGVIGIWESVFPNRIRGFYLFGSYSTGTADPSSDIDLSILFKEHYLNQNEMDQAQALCGYLEALGPAVWVDMGYLSEASVQQPDRVTVALRLKRTGRLIYGIDTRDQIAAEPGLPYIRDAMHNPFYASAGGRPALEQLVYPLNYPDDTKPFYGYENWSISRRDGSKVDSTKMLVVIVGWIASALVAQRTGLYVGSKKESAELYGKYIGDEWSALVEQAYEVCRNQWSHSIPSAASDRHHLRLLCEQALAFENYFYSIYRAFLLGELCSSDKTSVTRSLERLGQIVYAGQDVVEAIQTLVLNGDEDVRSLAAATLKNIHKVVSSE